LEKTTDWDLLKRPSTAPPQPEVSVDQNLAQYCRGLELVSEKMDNLSDQVTGVEHGLSNIRRNMKILLRKSNEREDAQNKISKKIGTGKATSPGNTNRKLQSHGSPYTEAQQPR
jgi:hypothetical protein